MNMRHHLPQFSRRLPGRRIPGLAWRPLMTGPPDVPSFQARPYLLPLQARNSRPPLALPGTWRPAPACRAHSHPAARLAATPADHGAAQPHSLVGSIPFVHSIPFHSIPLLFHSIPFHSIPFHSIPFHSIPFHSIALAAWQQAAKNLGARGVMSGLSAGRCHPVLACYLTSRPAAWSAAGLQVGARRRRRRQWDLHEVLSWPVPHILDRKKPPHGGRRNAGDARRAQPESSV